MALVSIRNLTRVYIGKLLPEVIQVIHDWRIHMGIHVNLLRRLTANIHNLTFTRHIHRT